MPSRLQEPEARKFLSMCLVDFRSLRLGKFCSMPSRLQEPVLGKFRSMPSRRQEPEARESFTLCAK